jgi:hypothetical protein
MVASGTESSLDPGRVLGLTDTNGTADGMIPGRIGGAPTGVAGLGCCKLPSGRAGVGRTTNGGDVGSELKPLLLIIHIPSPATEIKTRIPTITVASGIVRFLAKADRPVETEAPGPVTGAKDPPLTGASGMVISCKHKGHATRMPTYAVSQRIC